MTAETTETPSKPAYEPYTAADLLDTPDDGRKYEVLEGALVVSPYARLNHQRWVGKVQSALSPGCPATHLVLPGGHVDAGIDAPVPDVLIVETRTADEDLVFALPSDLLMVGEVLSPGQAGRDRLLKRSIYARMGIGVYWIVDPAAGTAQVLQLVGEDYVDAYVGPDLAEAARITWSLTG